MNKLFDAVATGHDPKARAVHICKDEAGFHVYKPATGFKSRSFAAEADEDLQAIYLRQCSCSQNNAFYEEGDRSEAPEATNDGSFRAFNMKTGEKNVLIQDAVIVKKGAKIMVQGHDGAGNKLSAITSLQKGLAAIAAGTAKQGWE